MSSIKEANVVLESFKAFYRRQAREALIIARKELQSYFYTPIAYIVMPLFLVGTGIALFLDFFIYNQAEMRSFFEWLPVIFIFAAPAVTMKLFSEERQSGSLEILMTMPVSVLDVVMGKFLAAAAFIGLMLAPTLLYVVSIVLVGSPDPGPVIGGYFSALLLGSAYAAIGLLASSLSRNQIVALFSGMAACLFLWLIGKIVIFLPERLSFLTALGTDSHFQNIARGILDSRDVIYFLSIIALCLIGTVRILEDRR